MDSVERQCPAIGMMSSVRDMTWTQPSSSPRLDSTVTRSWRMSKILKLNWVFILCTRDGWYKIQLLDVFPFVPVLFFFFLICNGYDDLFFIVCQFFYDGNVWCLHFLFRLFRLYFFPFRGIYMTQERRGGPRRHYRDICMSRARWGRADGKRMRLEGAPGPVMRNWGHGHGSRI